MMMRRHRNRAAEAAGHGDSRWLALALAGALAWVWSDLQRCQRRRRSERSPAKPEPLQTWEGEGGGLPAGHGSNQPAAHAASARP